MLTHLWNLFLSQPRGFFSLLLNLSQTSNDYFLSYMKLSLSFCLRLADTDSSRSLVGFIHRHLLFPAHSRVRNREISMFFCLKETSEKSYSHLHYLGRMKHITRKSRTYIPSASTREKNEVSCRRSMRTHCVPPTPAHSHSFARTPSHPM